MTGQTVPWTEDDVNDQIDVLIERHKDDPKLLPHLRAWRELGYWVTSDNQHMFTTEEVDDFLECVARHTTQ